MSETRPSFLKKMEVALIMVFFTGFIFWAVTKCNDTKEEYRRQALLEQEEEAQKPATPVMPFNVDTDSLMPIEEAIPADLQRITPLYVCFPELNMREQPGLNSKVILKLDLFEEVFFMNEVTSYRDSIRIDGKDFFEPWVRVKHQKGREGWVYGAGVEFYRTRR